MSTSRIELRAVAATRVEITDDSLTVELDDGRMISVPVAWYPRLSHGSREERNNWRLIGRGEGIHWPDLDEDLTVAGLLEGKRSGESGSSLKKWLASRKPAKPAKGRITRR